jgi:sugar lactone lactonase YvrE
MESGQSWKCQHFVIKENILEDVFYLNDVAMDAQGKGIYVADMGATQYMRDENSILWSLTSQEAKLIPALGRIYHISLNGEINVVHNTTSLMLKPNRVEIDNKGTIMVGEFFRCYFLVNKDGKLTQLKGEFRGADTVEQDSKDNYYIGSWVAGTVWKIDSKTEESTILIEGLQSATDFYLEEENGRLLVPDMLAGKIYSLDINN